MLWLNLGVAKQCVKKLMSNCAGLVYFPVRLADSVCYLPDGPVKFLHGKMFKEIQIYRSTAWGTDFLVNSQKKDYPTKDIIVRACSKGKPELFVFFVAWIAGFYASVLHCIFWQIALSSWVTIFLKNKSLILKYTCAVCTTITKFLPDFVMCSSSSATMAWSPRGMFLKSL